MKENQRKLSLSEAKKHLTVPVLWSYHVDCPGGIPGAEGEKMTTKEIKIRQIPATPKAPEIVRVAAYARVSADKDAAFHSLEAQIDYYRNYVASHPEWELIKIYSDNAISGTVVGRPEFQRMMEDARAGKIDLILTKSISRFARNTVDTLQTVRKLKEKGVEVHFEKENIHTFDPKCEVMLTIMSSIAQEESRSISENVRWGKEKSMRDGNVYVPYSHFLGYRKGADGRMEIVPEEAEIVRGIYNDFLAGKTISQIANSLTAHGIPTPGGKQKWSISTVRSILGNEKYKGDAVLQKTFTVDYLTKEVRKNTGEKTRFEVTNSHDAIIDTDVYERVQRELSRRRTARPRKAGMDSPFANRLVCADCGAFYGHKVWRSRGKSRSRYDVWYCNHRYSSEEKCNTPTLREEEIKAAFGKCLKKLKRDECEYTDALWRKLVETVTIRAGRKATFLLTDGTEVTVTI